MYVTISFQAWEIEYARNYLRIKKTLVYNSDFAAVFSFIQINPRSSNNPERILRHSELIFI